MSSVQLSPSVVQASSGSACPSYENNYYSEEEGEGEKEHRQMHTHTHSHMQKKGKQERYLREVSHNVEKTKRWEDGARKKNGAHSVRE